MLGLPKTTEISRILNKEDILKNADFKNFTKSEVAAKIDRVRIVGVLNSKTLNISAGETWKEIDIVGIELKTQDIEDEIIKAIDKSIPRPIVYILKNNFAMKLAISSKEKVNSVKIDTFFTTDWVQDFELKIIGQNIDNVYANFLSQIAGEKLSENSKSDMSESFASLDSAKDAIEKMKEREKIQKQIDILTRKINSEPSLGKRQALAEERYRLKAML